jgi:hypothetical protein
MAAATISQKIAELPRELADEVHKWMFLNEFSDCMYADVLARYYLGFHWEHDEGYLVTVHHWMPNTLVSLVRRGVSREILDFAYKADAEFDTMVGYEAARIGNLDALKWIISLPRYVIREMWHPEISLLAVRRGDVEILKFIANNNFDDKYYCYSCQKKFNLWHPDTFLVAIGKVHMKVLILLASIPQVWPEHANLAALMAYNDCTEEDFVKALECHALSTPIMIGLSPQFSRMKKWIRERKIKYVFDEGDEI